MERRWKKGGGETAPPPPPDSRFPAALPERSRGLPVTAASAGRARVWEGVSDRGHRGLVAPLVATGHHPDDMTAPVSHRTYCRICIAGCGLEVDVEDGRAVAVRGDADHPLSSGYTCSKGRALPMIHHDVRRLDRPMLRVDGELRSSTWAAVLDDLRHRLDDVVRESGSGSVGFFLGGGIYMDTAGYWCFRRISRRFET